MQRRRITATGPVDVGASLRCVTAHRTIRPVDPRRDHAAEGWWAGRVADEPVTVRVTGGDGWIEGEAWGPGAAETLERLGDLCGLDDDPRDFRPEPGIVADLHRARPGLRLGKTSQVFETVVPVVLAQKVTGLSAWRSYAALARSYGDPAPGPVHGWIAPAASVVARLSPDEMHRLGVERKRAVTLIEAARRAHRLEEAVAMPIDDAYRRLTAVSGIGPWTAGHVMAVSLGDPDAVPVGDYHLPHTVAWALARQERADDRRMLELLEPYRPHRRRVVALLKLSGARAPRFGPRASVEDFSRR